MDIIIILALIIGLPLLIWRSQRKAQERADREEREKWSDGITIKDGDVIEGKPGKKNNGTLIAIILALVVVVFVVFATMWQLPKKPAPKTNHVTMNQYLRLRTDMSYRQAVEILGSPGVETARSEMVGIVTVMYAWQGEDLGANMNAMFQNDKLITKAQYGLK